MIKALKFVNIEIYIKLKNDYPEKSDHRVL